MPEVGAVGPRIMPIEPEAWICWEPTIALDQQPFESEGNLGPPSLAVPLSIIITKLLN